jgi:excisionase family DNA binding protein
VAARTHTAITQKGPSNRSASSTGSQNKRLQPSALDPSRTSSMQGRRGGGLGGTRAVRVPPAYDQTAASASLLLRPMAVATTLGISRSKVFELLAAQELPSVHIGRSTRIPRAQLEEWIRAQVCWKPQAPAGLLARLRAAASTRT